MGQKVVVAEKAMNNGSAIDEVKYLFLGEPFRKMVAN
jgi:hypothetical protein